MKWTLAESDFDKVRVLRSRLSDPEWRRLMDKFDSVDKFGEQGINLVNPEFRTFKIV